MRKHTIGTWSSDNFVAHKNIRSNMRTLHNLCGLTFKDFWRKNRWG